MQPISQPLPQPRLHDWQIVEKIAPFLSISDLLKTSTLSKEFNFTLRNYFRKYILPQNSKTTTNSTSQLAIAKKIFHRQIKSIGVQSAADDIITLTCPKLIFKSIQIGTEFTLFDTLKGEKVIVKNQNLQKESGQIKHFCTLPKIWQSELTCLIGQYIYASRDNKLMRHKLVAGNGQGEELPQLMNEQLVEIAEVQTGEIISIKISQTHIFLITKNALEQNHLFAINFKYFTKKPTEVAFEFEEANKRINPQMLTVGAQVAYYIESSKVYQLDIEGGSQPTLLKSLKDKNIRRIINGSKHFFAIEQKNKLAEEWNNADVIEWALNTKEGFQDYIKIFKSQKVTGKTLLTMEKRYMQDVLGLLNHKLQQRLHFLLQQANKQTQENCIIYGWGRNDKSQLGINPSNPVSNPYKIKLPEGFAFLKCQNNLTLIHNQKTGEICCNSVQGNNKQQEWKVLFSHIYNIWSISASKGRVSVLCPIQKDWVSQNLSETPVHQKKEKLRTAKNIIDKIQWDENVDKKDFRVGYFDKYSGILQISFEEMQMNPDIKDYRVEYFKKKTGEVVWSKKDRIDIF